MTTADIPLLLIDSFTNFLNFYLVIIFVRLLLTWFPNIDWMQQIVGLLSPITDPYLNLFRFVPPIGTIDLSPILAIFALQLVAIPALAAIAPMFSSY
ncbi:MAG: YggT family protein [Chamaesiphon sp.]|nr:YggT family protein [Chamaesiphon sp.]